MPMSIFQPPDLVSSANATPYVPEPLVLPHKSAGTAWLLSLLLPGGGQFYCRAGLRGGLMLGFFALAIALAVLADEVGYVGIRAAIVIYAFSALDAYLTARDIDRGIEADAPENPRVAALLNLTTSGFGYVYLGRRIGWLLVFL